MAIGGERGKTREQHGATRGPEVPEAAQKRLKSGHSSDTLPELLILGPWVRVPPGSPWEPTGFGDRQFPATGRSHAIPPKWPPDAPNQPGGRARPDRRVALWSGPKRPAERRRPDGRRLPVARRKGHLLRLGETPIVTQSGRAQTTGAGR